MKQHAPATARNREAIREVLARVIPTEGVVLGLADGTGEHAVFFARSFPALTWQPSDMDPTALASITAWRAEAGLTNLREPLRLDVTAATWPIEHADAVTCINMIHISPWQATLGMLDGVARLGAPMLYLYGPYKLGGEFTAPSNVEFDQSLRARDPRWGVRDVRDVEAAATQRGFALSEIVAMPANNHSLVFRRPSGR